MSVFSKTCEYALRAVFYIAKQTESGRKVGIKDIAQGIESPELYLGKILQDLSRKGLIGSAKGPNGGFFLTREMLALPLIEVVRAVDGDNLFIGCGLGLKFCSAVNPCPLHDQFLAIRTGIVDMLTGTSIGSFNKELIDGFLSLKK